MPVKSFRFDVVPSIEGGTSFSHDRKELEWSGLPSDVTIKQCYWTFDIERIGNSTARWYEYNNASNFGIIGENTTGTKFVVTNVTGTSGTARIYLGAKNGTVKYNNLTFNIEYAYKQSSMTLSAATVEAGKAITANIAAQISTATHTLVWKLGSNTPVTQTLAAGDKSSSFTVPLSWIPNATSASATCTLTTLEGGAQVGESQTLSFTVTVNGSIVPSCTVSAALVNGFSGLYLGGRSSVKLTIGNAQAGSGASIKSYKLSGSGYSRTSQTATFGPLNAGTHTFTATVTDSRGRTGTATVNVTVQAYASPTLSGVSIYRSDSGGAASETGGYIALKATVAYTSLGGENAMALRGRYRPVNGAWSGWTTMTSGTRLLLGSGALSSTASYEAQIQAADTVGNTASYAAIIPTASVTFNLKEGGKGAAFGKYAEGNGLELAADWGAHRDGLSLTPAPMNLLDNSDFTNPVNQRGVTTGWTTGYGIDRWRMLASAGSTSIDVTADGLAITNTGTSSVAYIQQNLDDALFNKMDGKAVTIAACLSDGSIVAGSKVCAAGMELQVKFTGGDIRLRRPSGSPFMCRVVNTVKNSTITVKWVALYEGAYTADTLPEYVPKGYAAELAECQRYYVRFQAASDAQFIPGGSNGNNLYATLQVPVAMRLASPTLSYENINIYPYIVGAAYDVTSLEIVGTAATGNFVALRASHGNDSMAAGALGCIRILKGGYIALSADL